ncbi:MAG TPA: 16S rRNA (cytosine(967)-C(5))-methyltransferase RsmB [Firmicutes bacterium]|nr:16S rRNA (cytosine(967)-C(5))-methyltransferase RsmB [Bacillota bacterium]
MSRHRVEYADKGRVAQASSLQKQKEKERLSARDAALLVLREVELQDAYVNLALNRMLGSMAFSSNERALLTELAYGVLQRLNTLDWALSLYLDRPLPKLTPWIRNILRIGAYQLCYLRRIPPPAAVDEAVKQAHRYGHHGVASLVNAILRKLEKTKEKLPWPSRRRSPELYLSLYYSYPQWMIHRWLAEFGLKETEALCAAGNEPAPLTVRANSLRLNRHELAEKLKYEGVETLELPFAGAGLQIKINRRLEELECFQRGLFQVQGEASMLVAPLLNPQPGEMVLDLCSAPGGKTVHLAELMQNRGTVIAADLHPHRLKLVEATARRQGVGIIFTEKLDGRHMPAEKQGCFHRVLLDVPCSGLGVLRRKGDLKWRRQPEDIPALAHLQHELLRGAFTAVRPGGVLLYSACTFEPEETTEVIKKFLNREPSAYLSFLSPLLPPSLSKEEKAEGMLQLWPQHHDLDGFFIARIRKKDR